MTGEAGVRLFRIVQPGVGSVQGWRNRSDPEFYRLSVAGQPDWLMTPQTAARLGRAANRLLSVADGNPQKRPEWPAEAVMSLPESRCTSRQTKQA